jgi:hypothetical protein
VTLLSAVLCSFRTRVEIRACEAGGQELSACALYQAMPQTTPRASITAVRTGSVAAADLAELDGHAGTGVKSSFAALRTLTPRIDERSVAAWT